jgi:hypothetical protein
LNKFAFLITLVHEIAHLNNWNQFKESVKPHGEEWKKEFRELMAPFMRQEIFPPEIISALKKYLQNPSASSCTDIHLQRVLKKYNTNSAFVSLEQLPLGCSFKTTNNKLFVKGKLIRKRFLCHEISSKKQYLFSAIAEVIPLTERV